MFFIFFLSSLQVVLLLKFYMLISHSIDRVVEHNSQIVMDNNFPPLQSHVVIAFDATKELKEHELQLAVTNIRLRGGILSSGNTLLLLGVLHTVLHPMGYLTRVCTDSMFGTSARAMEEEVSKKVDSYVNMLQQNAEQCKDEGVDIKVKITAGIPIKQVIWQEVISCRATWLILERHLRKDLRFYERHIPCKVGIILDSLSLQVRRRNTIIANDIDVSEQKLFYSLSKSVEPISVLIEPDNLNFEQSVISCGSSCTSFSSQEGIDVLRRNSSSSSSSRNRQQQDLNFSSNGKSLQAEPRNPSDSQSFRSQHSSIFENESSEKPVLCAGCGLRTVLYIKDSIRFRFSDIQAATSDFSKENLLGEGGFGHVFKGRLKDGQIIAAKLRKEASLQGFTEFHSEIFVLSFARHKNIVMLLGYCSRENYNILVYEYICNKSLEWHLLNKSAPTLEWHQRHAIAIGTAKGLRFLHEECRGGPVIHRDLRPSNILLTHDFVPMIGDFGLAKWKTNEAPIQTRVLGTLGYLAPEYAENGIVSVRTDVYSFGIVLLQLISGRNVINENQEEQSQSLLQWKC
ncbi:proline-rich receptor-like protein kinase PERK13 isoform X2 [Magnolia sinica]|uniref:proline-rich receptor-like protein kinase PERK13 isoform X2 n=1 Tax=Magnolia sinica TaxID=86752 RepID=UPI002659B269|nr:proline-rich receptor-like protein kinase PERK13 isoform X2 [Magnolia sinica]